MYAFAGRQRAKDTHKAPIEDFEDSGYGGSESSPPREPQPQNQSAKSDLKSRRASGASAAETQLKYNHDRHEISRSITEAKKVAKDFKIQATNTEWPMQVPLADSTTTRTTRPGCARTSTTQSVTQNTTELSPKRLALKRSSTTSPAEGDVVPEIEIAPDVLSQDIRQQLQILRPEIMMAAHEENIIHTMNPKAVGEIMEQQFIKVQKHLGKLHVRVEDIASKVLVTGDLNAGKSTFCNALLRQKVLPTDQQPCTEVFCEVLDARENEDRSEVHAVLHNKEYAQDDPSTYQSLAYHELAAAVMLPNEYSALKVYVDDERPISESLVRNGVVDISLIDAPGLNSDSLQTTAVYARQEEIDVVVFVVSAENHFTLSAKQFLWNAANEKAYLFIVVNRFDNIKDKDRCRRLILEQIAKLSPKTHADAAELVHFVSADGVLERQDDSSDDAFAELELQLRNFVLNKRSQSKLAPARNFVGKFWSDVKAIATYNCDIATEENAKLQSNLLQINGKLNHITHDRQESIDKVVTQNDTVCEHVRQQTKDTISASVTSLSNLQPGHKYAGLFDCLNYANALKDQYLDSVQFATIQAELYCRTATSHGVDVVRKIGLTHLDAEQYKLKPLNVKVMFSRKRDAIQRKLPVDLQILDFVDFSNFEAVVGTSSLSAALLLYGGKTLGWSALVDTSFRVLNTVGIERTPKLLGGLAVLVLAGLGTYVVLQIPHALHKNLARKVQERVQISDYIDTNANRISSECRKVLQTPENELRLAFASLVEAEQRTKFAIEKQILTASATIDFFKRQNQVIIREERRLEKHEAKRQIQNRILIYRTELEDATPPLSEQEIEEKVLSYRKTVEDEARQNLQTSSGRERHKAYQSHDIAVSKTKEMDVMRSALGVSEDYKEGTSIKRSRDENSGVVEDKPYDPAMETSVNPLDRRRRRNEDSIDHDRERRGRGSRRSRREYDDEFDRHPRRSTRRSSRDVWKHERTDFRPDARRLEDRRRLNDAHHSRSRRRDSLSRSVSRDRRRSSESPRRSPKPRRRHKSRSRSRSRSWSRSRSRSRGESGPRRRYSSSVRGQRRRSSPDTASRSRSSARKSRATTTMDQNIIVASETVRRSPSPPVFDRRKALGID